MRVCYFGTYERNYPRNSIFINGLKQNNVDVYECHSPLWEKTQSKGKEFGFSIAFMLSFVLSQIHLLFRYIFFTPKHDIIIVGYIGQLDMFLAKLLALIGRKILVFNPLISLYDTVISDRGYFNKSSLKARFFRFLDKATCNLADLVLLDTNAHIQFFQNELTINDVLIKRVPVGADDKVFFPNEDKSEKEPFMVMFIGKFIPLHGIDKIVETAILLKENKNIKFILIGIGQLRKSIEEKIRTQSLENIELINWIPYHELVNRMNSADLLLGIFGDSEKAKRVIPNKLYQALAVQKPILTADTDALNELLIPDEHVYSCKADPSVIARKIRTIMEDTSGRKKVALQGYNLFQEQFSVNKLGNMVKGYLNEL